LPVSTRISMRSVGEHAAALFELLFVNFTAGKARLEDVERCAVGGTWCGVVPCHGPPSQRTRRTASAITTASNEDHDLYP
jgi:hypothetical protein